MTRTEDLHEEGSNQSGMSNGLIAGIAIGVLVILVIGFFVVRGAWNWATTPAQPTAPVAKSISLRSLDVNGGPRPEVYKPIVGGILGEYKIVEDANQRTGGTMTAQVTINKVVTVGVVYKTVDGKTYYSSKTDEGGNGISNLESAAKQAIAALMVQLKSDGFTVETVPPAKPAGN